MKLSELLDERLIEPDMKADTKDEALRELVNVVVRKYKDLPGDQILEAVRQREDLMSTGIGNEVGLPHAKTSAVKELIVAFGRSLKGIDFDALDGRPVKLFFLLLAPEDQSGPHVKALAQISRLLKQSFIRDSLLEAKNAKEIIEILKNEEEKEI